MPGNLQPLDQKFPIVGPDGEPTIYFVKWAQQRQIDIGLGITAEQALQIVVDYLATHPITQGNGISIVPSGNLSDDITISALVQEILDQITTVHGSVLYRDSGGWAALAPGTTGNFLQTQGAGADPVWAAGGGGSAAWATLDVWDFAIDGAIASLPVDVSNLQEVLVYVQNVTASSAGLRGIQVSVDGGVTYFTVSADYVTFATTGITGLAAHVYIGSSSSAAARSGIVRLNAPDLGISPVCLEVPNRAELSYFVGSASPITHIRAANFTSSASGAVLGTLTGGRITVLGR